MRNHIPNFHTKFDDRNLSIIWKLLQHFVAGQLVTHLGTLCLLPVTQSGFRRGHSTETAYIRVLSDLLDAV